VTKQRASIDKKREGVGAEIEKINEASKAMGGGGGGSGYTPAVEKLGLTSDVVFKKFMEWLELTGILTDENKNKVAAFVKNLIEAGTPLDQLEARVRGYIQQLNLAQLQTNALIGGYYQPNRPTNVVQIRHEGGIVEDTKKYHQGKAFVGNLKTNEEFAKLMQGEYVSSEKQMDMFMRKTLPSLMERPSIVNSSSLGDTVINLAVNVSGSLDSSVLPELKTSVLKEVNEALRIRGIKRNASSVSI